MIGKDAIRLRCDAVGAKLGFSCQFNRKADEGSRHPDRHAQFKHIIEHRQFCHITQNWRSRQHTIKVERLFAGVPGLELPFLLEATCRCPPEDVGGPSGYMELLAAIAAIAAIADPQHPRHAEAKDLLGADYRPAALDASAIEKAVGELASKWTAKSRKPKGTAKLAGA